MDANEMYQRALANARTIAEAHMKKFHNQSRKKQEAGPASRYSRQFLLDGYPLTEAFGLNYFMQLFVQMLLNRIPDPKVLVAGADPAYAEQNLVNMGCETVYGFDPIPENIVFAQRRWKAQNFRQFDPLEADLPYETAYFNGVWMHNLLMELYWAPQLKVCVERLAQVTAPGGLVFITYKEEPRDLNGYVAQMRDLGFDFTFAGGHIDRTQDIAMKTRERQTGITGNDRKVWRDFHWWNGDEPQPDEIFLASGFRIAEFDIGGQPRKVAGNYFSGRNWNSAFRCYEKVV